MNLARWDRSRGTSSPSLTTPLFLIALAAFPTAAAPSFISYDPRLPNPDRPYVMTSGTVDYGTPLSFSLYELSFQPTNPDQLDFPMENITGQLAFESSFDISYDAVVSFGAGPAFPISGIGTARAVGTAPLPVVLETADFDTQLLALNLQALSPIPEFILRVVNSSGTTEVEGGCYGVCPPVVLPLRISSFFDVFTEVSFDGGNTWAAARNNTSIHLEQTPEPGAVALAALCGLITLMGPLGRTPRRQRFL